MKRIISGCLALILLVSLLPSTLVFAQETEDRPVIADGYYYIQNVYTQHYLQVADGQVKDDSFVCHIQKDNGPMSAFDQNPYVWRIKYLGNGKYSVRPYHKLDMGLCLKASEEEEYPYTVIRYWGEDDQLSMTQADFLWTIELDENGYVIKQNGSNDFALYAANFARSLFPYVFAAEYDASISNCHWQFIAVYELSEGVALFDTTTANSHLGQGRDILVGQTRTMEDMGLVAISYSTTSLSQDFTWTSTNPDIVSVDSTTGAVTAHAMGYAAIVGTHNISGQSVFYVVSNMRAYVAGLGFKEVSPYPEDEDYIIEAICESLQQMGYNVSYDTLVSRVNLVNAFSSSEVIFLEGHGDQHTISMSCNEGRQLLITDNPVSETENDLTIWDYDLSNVDLIAFLACATASDMDGTGTNLSSAAYLQGAQCVLGWAESFLWDEQEIWQSRFQSKLREGWPVEDAVRYANSFLYFSYAPLICTSCHTGTFIYVDGYNICSNCGRLFNHFSFYIYHTIKSTRIYGNGDLVVAAEKATTLNYGEPDEYVDFLNAPPDCDPSDHLAVFELICASFTVVKNKYSKYFIDINYTSDDGDDYILDFIYVEFPTATPPGQLYGYTVIVENNQIVGIRDNSDPNW